jgi:hypothetical protein
MESIIKRNFLKYSAGNHIFCPKCDQVADFRRWVTWQSPAGNCGACCSTCWQKALDFVHDNKPHAYLISIGWEIESLVKFDKVKTVKPTFPQKPGKVLGTFLRKDIFKGHKNDRGHVKDRVFPSIVHSTGLPITRNDDGQWSDAIITAQYVAKFCQLNHLTEC